jgi:hypothetical protein
MKQKYVMENDFLCFEVKRCEEKIEILIFKNQKKIFVKKYAPQ